MNMATPAVEIPPSTDIPPGSRFVQQISIPKPVKLSHPDAEEIAAKWTSLFNDSIKGVETNWSSLFLDESYWRDMLCLTWDFHTLLGPKKISSLCSAQKHGLRIKSLSLDKSSSITAPSILPVDFKGEVLGIYSFLTVETEVGRGRGLVKLLPDPKDRDQWKAFSLFTTLQELKGYEELVNTRRVTGVEHGAHHERMNWQERRIKEENFEGDLEPTVLIVGKSAVYTLNYPANLSRPSRIWSRRVSFRSSTEAIRRQHLDNRSNFSDRRQLAEPIPSTRAP